MKLPNKITGSLTVALALALTGCSGSSGGGADGGGDAEEITILGAFTDVQAEAFQADLDKWSETSGIKVTYDGNTDFQTAVVSRATAGNPPDIAIYPQPGVLKSQTSNLYPLEDLGIDVAAITADEANGLGTIAQVDGTTFALPYSINVKSLVWYNPSAFEAAGLSVPTTDAELTELAWVDLDAARKLDLPRITRVILDDLEAAADAGFPPYRPIPFYFERRGKGVREEI